MDDLIDGIRAEFHEAVDLSSKARDFADLKVAFLGKKGRLTAMLRNLGSLRSEERTRIMKKINALKAEMEETLDRCVKAAATAAERIESDGEEWKRG